MRKMRIIALMAVLAGWCQANTNLSVGKPYQLSVAPYDQYNQYKDSTGPQSFVDTALWYRGELTNGLTATSSYWDFGYVHINQQGPYSVIIDLQGQCTVSRFKVHVFAGGLYGCYAPSKVELYVTNDLSPTMTYEEFCSSFQTEKLNWTYLGAATHTLSEDGNSSFTYWFDKTVTATSAKLAKVVITDKLVSNSSTQISEVEIWGTRSSTLPAAGSLVAFPPEGRDAFFPINLDTFNKTVDVSKFLIGNSADMTDSPYGSRRATAEMIQNIPNGMRTKGIQQLTQMGTRTLRFWDNIWVNYRSYIEGIKVQNWCTGGNTIPPATEDPSINPFPYYWEIIDFCAQNNWVCVMVLDTFYYDPTTDKVYRTPEVCRNSPDDPTDPYYTTDPNDPNGILYKAIARNVLPIAQYYKNQGYTSGLILEIGNECIGYVKKPNEPDSAKYPTKQEYARMVLEYAKAIKLVSPDIGTTIYPWPDESLFVEVAKVGAGKYVDYCVTHHYAPRFNVGALTQDFTFFRNALESAGLGHVKLLLTEYCLDWNNVGAHSYSVAVKQLLSELAMLSHPGVAGMHEFALFGNAKMTHSDTNLWTVRRYGEFVGHPVDQRPDLRWRYVTLPSGMTQTLLTQAARGTLLKHWPGVNAKIAGVMSQENAVRRVFLVNPTSSAMPLQWSSSPAVISQKLLTSTAEYFSHTLTQPWSITTTTGGALPTSIPANAVLLVELAMPAFEVQKNSVPVPNQSGSIDGGVVRKGDNVAIGFDVVNQSNVPLGFVEDQRIILQETFLASGLDQDLWETASSGSYVLSNGQLTLTTTSSGAARLISKPAVRLTGASRIVVRADNLKMQDWARGTWLQLVSKNAQGQIDWQNQVGFGIDLIGGQTAVFVGMRSAGQPSQYLAISTSPQYVQGNWTLTCWHNRVTLENDAAGVVFDSAVQTTDNQGVPWRFVPQNTNLYLVCGSGYVEGYWFRLDELRYFEYRKASVQDNDGFFSMSQTPPSSISPNTSASMAIDGIIDLPNAYSGQVDLFTNFGRYRFGVTVKGTFRSDIDRNGAVGTFDLQQTAADWLATGTTSGADIDRDGAVDIEDFAILASEWLQAAPWLP